MKMEEIYPLTIVGMKHGKFAVVEGLAICKCVISLQEDEEVQYAPDKFMKEQWEYINYGIGDTINDVFENFKTNLKQK